MSLHSAGRHAVDPGAVTESGHLRGHDACIVVERPRDTAQQDDRLHRGQLDQPRFSRPGNGSIHVLQFSKKKKTAYRRSYAGHRRRGDQARAARYTCTW